MEQVASQQKFIIIDHDLIASILLTRLINKCIFGNVLTFTSYDKALDFISKIHVNQKLIIFTEVYNAHNEACEFFNKYATLLRQDAVIALTASLDTSDREMIQKHNTIFDYIIKPMTIQKMKSVIDSLVNSKLC